MKFFLRLLFLFSFAQSVSAQGLSNEPCIYDAELAAVNSNVSALGLENANNLTTELSLFKKNNYEIHNDFEFIYNVLVKHKSGDHYLYKVTLRPPKGDNDYCELKDIEYIPNNTSGSGGEPWGGSF